MSESLSASTLQWDRLSEVMASFIEAWESNDAPPTIAEYLANQPTASAEVVLVELIKIDLEKRFSRGESVRLEAYVQSFPAVLVDGNPPCDLIYEEFHIRKQAGEHPTPDEYYRRFPACKAPLARLLGGSSDSVETTSLAEKLPPVGFNVGETIDDFTIVAPLGSGAFASVFLARQRSMQRLVALKISQKKSREPETLAQLEHPHIVRVYDQRLLPERKITLLYMQYAPGGTLRDVIELMERVPASERTGSLVVQSVDQASERAGYPASENASLRRRLSAASWPQVVCRIGAQLAMALDFAHKRGVLHRDVKPANVLLSSDYSPKLADFNTSFGSQLEGATPRAFFGGSLAYMSPEQIEAFNPDHDRSPDSLDGRTDLFSLAALLWELLYGVRPFREDDLPNRWTQMLERFAERRKERPVPPERSSDPLQTELSRILLQALEPDPASRPQDGAEFARELLLCLAPKSKSLIEIPRFGWRKLARAHPLITIIVVVLLPNMLGALFNYLYLRSGLVLKGEEALWAYGKVACVLNVVYFSFGAVVANMIVAPLSRAVKSSDRPGALTSEEALKARLQSLRFGDLAALIGVVLWCTSGLAFPLGIMMLVPDSFGWRDFPNFLAAMTICGLISAAYPFFGLTYVIIQVFYPALLRVSPGTDADEVALMKLESKLFKYLFAAGIIPLASMLLVVQNPGIIISLILAGLAGLAVTYALYQKIREDIAALLVTVRPLEKLGVDTESRTGY